MFIMFVSECSLLTKLNVEGQLWCIGFPGVLYSKWMQKDTYRNKTFILVKTETIKFCPLVMEKIV